MKELRVYLNALAAAVGVCLAGCGGADALPVIAFDRTSPDLGAVVAGGASAQRSFQLSNSGGPSGALATAVTGETADFTIEDGCAGKSLAHGQSCTMRVAFRPSAAGARAAVLTISSARLKRGATLVLAGTGLAPASIALDGTAQDFGTVEVGAESPAVTFSLTNAGEVPSAALATAVTGNAADFVLHDGCAGLALPGGASCAISVSAAPKSHDAKAAGIQVSNGEEAATLSVSAMGRDHVMLTVALGGTGGGVVAAPGLSCTGSACTGEYARTDTVQTVTLSATPAARSFFAGWDGACPASIATCSVTMDRARAVTVVFTLLPAALEVDAASGGFGTVDVSSSSAAKTFTFSNPGGVGTGPLSASITGAAADFAITDGCTGKSLSGGDTCAIAVALAPHSYGTKAAGVTVSNGSGLGAGFTLGGVGRDSVTLSVAVSGKGAVSGDGLSCLGTSCSGTYVRAATVQTVTLDETADISSTFAGWGGACSGVASTCEVIADADKSVTAGFTLKTFVLSLHESLQGGGGGSIASDPVAASCADDTCDSTATLDYGTQVTLTATPADGSLVHWSGACSGAAATCHLEMIADQSATGIFNATNYVFVTSTTYGANLGGLAGGDAACKARAAAAGLPGNYVAWLSTTNVPARTRLGSARGWIRLDGLPVADLGWNPLSGAIAGLSAGQVFYPPRIDETGADIRVAVATGTTAEGDAWLTCKDWTSASVDEAISIGISTQGPVGWTAAGGSDCAGLWSLYCFGTDLSRSVSPAKASGRKAFVTRNLWTPGGGIGSADAACAAEASAAKLDGTFLALMATTAASAASRFDTSGGSIPWVRTDGLPVVSASPDLLAGKLLTPISVFADGAYPDPFVEVWPFDAWTGAVSPDATGDAAGTCTGWTDNLDASEGWSGQVADASPDYFVVNASAPGLKESCSRSLLLYCLEQ